MTWYPVIPELPEGCVGSKFNIEKYGTVRRLRFDDKNLGVDFKVYLTRRFRQTFQIPALCRPVANVAPYSIVLPRQDFSFAPTAPHL